MTDPQRFDNYRKWCDACAAHDSWRGPFQVSGQPHLYQFVDFASYGETAAIWNQGAGIGYILVPVVGINGAAIS